jgi:hypothetical protein
MVQLNLMVLPVMLYPKSLTDGGLFPLGGSGGPFLPHPYSISTAASQIVAIRAVAVADFIFPDE